MALSYQNQRMVLIHEIVTETLKERSESSTRQVTVKAVDCSWQHTPY